MRGGTIFCVLFLAGAVMPADAALMDARTVREFLPACARDKAACAEAVAGRVTAEDSPDRSGDVCLNDDQRDQPGTIYISILRWLTGRREVAGMRPAEAIDQAAGILYPCIDNSPDPGAP
jgi:hypothetical protein